MFNARLPVEQSIGEDMTPIEIKVESGLSVAVIFIENIMTAMLTDVRKKIREEVEELVPEEFHFLLNWDHRLAVCRKQRWL